MVRKNLAREKNIDKRNFELIPKKDEYSYRFHKEVNNEKKKEGDTIKLRV